MASPLGSYHQQYRGATTPWSSPSASYPTPEGQDTTTTTSSARNRGRGRGDRRQQSRIQGGWAPPGKTSQGGRGRGRGRGQRDSSYEFEKQARQARHDTRQPVIFCQPAERIDVNPPGKPIEICRSGEYVISGKQTPRKSVVTLNNDFLEPSEAESLFHCLDNEVEWTQQIKLTNEGKEYLEPRKVCWYGEFPYAYSRVVMPNNNQWPHALLEMKERIEEKTGLSFNSVLANKYRNEKDGVAWHSDSERSLGPQPDIASLSLGETRMFMMRKNPPWECDPKDFSKSEMLKIPLTSGSLLLMTGYTQDDWQHQVPKDYHEKKTRINLTFRTIHKI